MAKVTKDQIESATALLYRALPLTNPISHPTLYTRVESVSRSGMRAYVRCYGIIDGKIVNLTHACAIIGGYSLKTIQGDWLLTVNGCGFDRGHDVALSIGHAMNRKDIYHERL